MAAKSDFAQKLLQDLRLRKERMAATQNSGSSRPASRGAQGNPGISHRGSKKVTALESVGRSGNSMRKSSSSRSSFHMEDSSNQTVLYGRGGNSERMGDLPTTLSIGFENGGKFTKIDASGSNQLLNFLHHISRRSVATGKMEIAGKSMGKIKSTSTGQFPTSYSHIHIHDVSKGVQKLNQILRTCSNGAGYDTYTIEIGKELLRGAMDLEESLRMLVNLQETSDYMVKSQRKSNKIKLLDEDEDDQTEVVKASELKVVALPRFSFDKPKEAERNGIKRQLMALTYPEEKQVRNSSSHSRTGSYVSDNKEPKDNTKSHSKQEKGRISNVIAKLMGLDEISAKQESVSTPLRELSSNKTEKMAAIGSPVNSKIATRNPMFDTGKMLKAETFSATPDVSSRVSISHRQWQNIEVAAKKYAGPGKQLDSQKHQMRENKEDKEKRSKMKTENGEMLAEEARQQSEPQLPHRHLSSKTEDSIELKRSAIQTRNTNVQSPQRMIKQQYNPGEQKGQLRAVPKKSDLLEQKRKQQLQKKKKQVYESHCNQLKTTVTSNPIKSTKCLPKKKPCDALAPSAVDKKKPVKDIGAKLPKDLSMNKLPKVKETSINLPQQVKNKISIQASKDHTCQEDAASNARSEITKPKQGTSDNDSPDQPSIKMQEKSLNSSNGAEHKPGILSEEAKVGITSLDKTEKKTESPNAEDFLHRIAQPVSISNLGEQEESAMLDVSETRPCNEESEDMATATPEPQEKQLLDQETTVSHTDIPLRSHEVLHQHRDSLNNGIHGESQELIRLEQHKKKQSNGAAELLTESEKHLKEKLIKGQLFLNTAEALFKLNIPISVLEGNDHLNRDPETKLILDCGHELLKKKGQKQESSLFPGKKSTFPKIRSFDGLIKQISKDFDTLKSYGGDAESDTAECLNTMLEKDFENTHSEVCCVWDFGWSEDPFGFQEHYEIAKDVEKRVLNGLLDDITKELLQISVVSSA